MYIFIKSVADRMLSMIFIVFLSPIYLLVYVMLYIDMRNHPIFTQVRPGKSCVLFVIRKFKTMTDQKNVLGELLPDSQRLTYLGRIIRFTSLDELPQLFNVINGDMSLIGPRPLLPEYLPLYSEEQRRRQDVKPGITGWAQVNGRNAISWEEKFELDVWYVDNRSFLLDLKILWMTFLKVVKRDGISSDTSVTMEKFKGSAC